MKQKLLLFLSVLLTTAGAWAQPEQGKYYRIVNERYNKVMKENWGSQDVTCNSLDNKDYAQIWMYTTTGALQNVYTGRYLQNQPNASNTFKTGQESVEVSFTTQSDGHLGINVSGNQLHCDASSNVVRWNDNGNEGNHWTVQEVSLSADEVKAAREEFLNFLDLTNNPSAYTEKLLVFFTNELCTELKAEYASMNDADLKAAMEEAGLPAMLQNVAVKVKNNWWNDTDKTTYADKNKYAKDFRVATYKPYSDANNWRDKMNTYAPSFMGNPTGIYATNKDVIHVFVGNDIPEGATLYLTPIRNHGRIGGRYEGTELKKGYNAVITTTDSVVYFMNYVVNTIPTSNVNAHTKTIAKVSDFPDLDIHIEGGQCVGYYQKPAENSTEEDEKYKYLIHNANDGMYFMVKGETSLFYFKKYTYTQHFSKTIWNSINWFDRLHFWEFAIIGVLDDVANGKCENGTENSKAAYPLNIKGGDAFYPTYCNNPTMAMEGPNGQNPHATTFYTSYPGPGGVESSFNAERENFDNWCAGHEHGHQIQGAYNLESCSESSVNLPSNIITYLTGYRLGRGWNFAQNYAYVAENKPFGLRDISITMRMYYNLFLYYHIGGKKKDFYPTFVKSLREDPMDFSRDNVQYQHPEWGAPNGGHHRAVNTWIKFYKKACDAAQEDLTEYFRMWGFFVPCDKEYFGDYTSYAVSLTQKEIDDAIAEVKAKGYPENLQIMFVEDRQIPRERTDIWAHTATGTQKYKPTNWEAWYTEEQLKKEYGDVGDILTYIDGSANTSEYTYTQSANKISLKGRGGVGFIVYDLEGNNRYMSNCLEFEIPVELVLNGFEIRSINADGTSNTVGADAETDYEQLNGMLETLLRDAQEIIDITITENSYRPGFYYVDSEISEFNSIYNYAKNIYDTKKQTSYQDAYLYLKQAMEDVKNNASTLPFVPNSTYVLTNKKYSGKSMDLNESGALCAAATDLTKASQQWVMESATEKDTYYIKNKSTSKYLGTLDRSVQISANVETQSSAKAYKLYNLGNALWALQCQTDKEQMSLHTDGEGKVVGWSHTASDNDGSWWYLTAVEVDETAAAYAELQTLMAQTEELLAQMGNIGTEAITLTADKYDSNAKYTVEGSDKFTSFDVLFDNNSGTFFHSDYSGNAPDADHYISMNTGQQLQAFNLHYTTRGSGNVCAPTSVVIQGSNNGNDWTDLLSVTEGLPTTNDASHTIFVPGNGNTYSHVRFVVKQTSTGQQVNNHYFFVVSELGLSKSIITPSTEYSSLATDMQSIYELLFNTQSRITSSSTQQECTTAYNNLKTQYEALVKAKKTADNKPLDDKKAKLKTLMDQTKALMDQCGTVKYTQVTLHTNDENQVGHLYCNAPYQASNNDDYCSAEESYNLLDKDYSSYLHTDYSSLAPNEDHYLRVYASETGISRFKFNYSTRGAGGDTYPGNPKTIVVEGSNEANGTYTTIATLTSSDANNPLPTTSALKHYTSEMLECGNTTYKYIRFRVTANEGDRKSNNHHWFYMSEFGFECENDYTVTLNGVGNVTEELLLATYKQHEKAGATHTYANTINQLEQAITALQAAYDELYEAANTTPRFRITDNAGNVFEGKYEGEKPVFNGVQYTLTNEVRDGNLYSADITFNIPFSISGPEATNLLMISSFNYSSSGGAGNFKWYASGSNVKAEKEGEKVAANRGVTSANVATHLWTIHPTISSDNAISFQIKNFATGLYINTESSNNSHDASAVTLSQTPINFTLGSRDNEGVEFINSHGKRLSVNSSGDGKGEQILGTWDSHYGTAITFPTPSYNVAITAAKAATLFTPIAVNIPEGVTAKYVKAEGENIGSEGRLLYTKLNGIIPANTAVVLTGEEGTYTFLETKETGEQVEGNVLFGYAEKTAVDGTEHEGTGEKGTVYALANKENGVAFYHYVGANYLAGKAYLDVKDLSAGTGVRLFNIFDAEIETGVTETESEHVKAEIYDLTGRRVRETRNGLYIVNGKRVIR